MMSHFDFSLKTIYLVQCGSRVVKYARIQWVPPPYGRFHSKNFFFMGEGEMLMHT